MDEQKLKRLIRKKGRRLREQKSLEWTRIGQGTWTGQVLEEVMDAKYLGVTLSNDLEWSKHIAIMTNKANSKLSFFVSQPEGLPEKLKQTAYFSLVRSFMEYGATVGTRTKNTTVTKLRGCSV